jgi:hypothetical protein
MPQLGQPRPDESGPQQPAQDSAPQQADEATLALGRARAAGSYLRSVVEGCELVRRLPSFGDPEQLRARVQVAHDAVDHHADLLAQHGHLPEADEIRLSAQHTVNDLVVRDWAEHAHPDLLHQWQAGDIGRDRAMTALRFAYAADPDNKPPAGRPAIRGSAGELLRAYLDAQFDEQTRPVRLDSEQNMLPEFEARTDRPAQDTSRKETTWPPDPTRESLERTRKAVRWVPEYPSNAELEEVGVTYLEYLQLTTIDRLLEEGRDPGIPGIRAPAPPESLEPDNYLDFETYEDLAAEIDNDI